MYNDETNKQRIKQIHTMLMEFASGNFSYNIERSNLDDDIEALTALVNMTFQEVKSSFIHQGYANLNETYKHVVQMFFVLDLEDTIIAFNSHIKQVLFFDDDELLEEVFSTFLTQDSKLAWNGLKSKLAHTNLDAHEEFIVLSFKTKQQLILTANCLVSKFVDPVNQLERIVITSIDIIKNSTERETELRKMVSSGKDKNKATKHFQTGNKSKRLNLSFSDIRKIRKVHDHIINNLDKPLAPLIELAHIFGTNEYKLKYGFKQLYGQTVFRFLINERLRKASILIQHTDTSIKEVAHATGFISAPHFSKAFKEKYGFTPRDLRKQSGDVLG
ncbi:helix-turn-helix domain-containing protein [Flavivirga spongiicola]|uniref:Helix-turn-helix domain-containing protein n=1 Tax=Flavivirga spongiicola TaxID=421621 RepID=A0ABU7XR06_9FLAO|nr:helix-turn-helix domain-containing protein [Flavivirga sp. MEBiC05379]MDO5978201.1 helix-turn-helix domain-containing protein [Flavivirga sp. MEBiC05379]